MNDGTTHVALMWFRKLGERTSVWFPIVERRADAAVVTVITSRWIRAMQGRGGRVDYIDPVQELEPSYWRIDACVAANLSTLRGRCVPCTVWEFGDFTSRELIKLQEMGFIRADLVPPKDPRFEPESRFSPWASVVLRIEADSVPLPFAQGIGHLNGVRFAHFGEYDEPTDIYDAWLASAEAGRWELPRGLEMEAPIAPPGASDVLFPYGSENRNHALISSISREPGEMVHEIASLLALPVLEVDMDEEAYNRWEWDNALPADVEALVAPLLPDTGAVG